MTEYSGEVDSSTVLVRTACGPTDAVASGWPARRLVVNRMIALH